MKVQKPNWYGLNHNQVAIKFEGNPTFVNDFCVNDEYQPSAIYYCANPNKSKNHKNYLLLTVGNGVMYVRGMDPEQMEKFRYQSAIRCLDCDEVVYSVMRHDMRHCSCGKVSIDGGKDYTRLGFEPNGRYETVILDLLTDTVKADK